MRHMILEPVRHFERRPFLGPKARQQASPGQRPGKTVLTDKALKGRNKVCRPFRALFFLTGYPGRCPGLACLRTVGAPLRRMFASAVQVLRSSSLQQAFAGALTAMLVVASAEAA